MKVKVNVTHEDIGLGVEGSPGFCPVAIALRRALPGRYPSLGRHVVTLLDFGHNSPDYPNTPKLKQAVNLPFEVSNWISDFDRGLPVQPFEFELDL